tara:strand:+ start:5401 stop:6561 length:1161 start_codon:yes stop_codon:yes gene_type:complete
MERITITQARRLSVIASFGSRNNRKGKLATLEIIQNLGYVQIDTISVIERAHHHVLWSRQPDYKPIFLSELLSEDKRVFEHWAHAVAYLPMDDYRFYLPKMESNRKPPSGKQIREVYNLAQPLFKSILKRIKEEGGLASKDFDHKRKRSSEGWWDWKPAKFALEFLYLRGDLMVSSRRNFQRVYDLTERVLPKGINLKLPDEEERAEHQIRRCLQSMGLARETEIVKYLVIADRKVIQQVLHDLVSGGKVEKLIIKGLKDDVYYALSKSLELGGSTRSTGGVSILSPFDNMTIQRERMRLLFDFDYTIECYVPAAKRKYGYFVCPILWKNDLVARIDMKADRKARKFRVLNLHYEESLKNKYRFEAALTPALQKFATFNGCEVVET